MCIYKTLTKRKPVFNLTKNTDISFSLHFYVILKSSYR